jgi:hypothetical protein
MGRHNPLPLAPPAPPRRTPPASPEEGTSYQSLQPTCCQRVPTGSFHSRAFGSRRPARRFCRCSGRSHAHTIVSSASSTTAPDSRKRHLRPRVVTAVAAALTSRDHDPLCPLGPPAPLGPGVTNARPVRPLASREVWSLTLPVTPPLRTGPRANPFWQRRGPFPRATRQRRCFPGPKRLPPPNPPHPRLVLALEPRPRGPPLVLRLCRLRPASDTSSRAGSTR